MPKAEVRGRENEINNTTQHSCQQHILDSGHFGIQRTSCSFISSSRVGGHINWRTEVEIVVGVKCKQTHLQEILICSATLGS